MAKIFSVEIDNQDDMVKFISGESCKFIISLNESVGNQLNINSYYIANEVEKVVRKLNSKYAKQTKADWYIAMLNERISEHVQNRRD